MATQSTPPSPHQASGRAARPLLRFAKPAERGPGWEATVDDDENYGRLRQPNRIPAHHHHHHHDKQQQQGARSGNQQSNGHDIHGTTSRPESIRSHKSHKSVTHNASHKLSGGGKRLARALIHDILAAVGEFVGTFLFLFLAFQGAQSATFNRGAMNDQSLTTTDNQTILFIALSFGFSLVVVAWAFFRITGSAFNPAVTLSLWLVGGLTARRAVSVVLAQLIGGIAAAGLSKAVTLGTFSVQNTLVAGLSSGKGLVIEMFTTALLCFVVLMLAAEKSRSTFLAPVAIGLALFVGHLASIGWTGAGINPARTLGPSVVNASFPSNAWIYYLGQFLGSLIATAIYVLLKHLDYEEVVANIDSEDANQSAVVDNAPLMNVFQKTANVIPGVQVGEGSAENDEVNTNATAVDDPSALEEGRNEKMPGGTMTDK